MTVGLRRMVSHVLGIERLTATKAACERGLPRLAPHAFVSFVDIIALSSLVTNHCLQVHA